MRDLYAELGLIFLFVIMLTELGQLWLAGQAQCG